MPSMILEGGTFRPIFSCGVMDALLEEDIMFPYIIGVSAGISDGISYISKQIGRNMEIGRKYRNDKRYMGIGNYRTQKSIFGLDFVFGEIPQKLIPFDWDTYMKYDGQVLVGVTNAITGEPEYLDGKTYDPDFTMFRATCALPFLFPTIEVNGTPYYDGGVSDPIPIRKAMEDGNDKHLIILTRPKEYVKTLGQQNKFVAHKVGKKYPKIREKLLTRHIAYNETVKFCEQLEAQGKAIIIRPEYAINSLEKDINVLEKTYQHGYELAKGRMQEIKDLF